MSVLTTNDKTIKLWKVYEKKLTCLSEFNLQNGSSTLNRATAAAAGGYPSSRIAHAMPTSILSTSTDALAAAAAALAERTRAADILRVPKVVSTETVLASKCRKVYSSAHTYHINSISISADQEAFLSSDDLRINLWHLDRPDTSFNVVDIKPSSMEDLTEVITAAEFSNRDPNLFAYGSSKGSVRIADLRASALCDRHSKCFDDQNGAPGSRTFFSEIISSVNDVKFVPPDGTHFITRDYMTVRLWDIRYEVGPVASYGVHDSLRNKLSELYENDAIFDKFDVACSGDGANFATGTYSSFFRIVPRSGGAASGEALLEANRDPTRRRLAPSATKMPSRFVGFGRSGGGRIKPGTNSGSSTSTSSGGGIGSNSGGGCGIGSAAAAALASAEDTLVNELQLQNKIQHLSWHPTVNVIATAASNSLYLFYGKDAKQQQQGD